MHYLSSFWRAVAGLAVAAVGVTEASSAWSQSRRPSGVAPAYSLAPLLKTVVPSVVSVRVIGEAYKPFTLKNVTASVLEKALSVTPKAGFRSGGSGVIVDATRGLILTNHHVVENAVDVSIALSTGEILPAKLLGTDAGSDIAVLQVNAKGLASLPLGNSDRLQVGDYVVAVGSPYGLEKTATFGIVSALLRTDVGHGLFEQFVQMDAAINPGNSGGALVTMDGKLIAINTASSGKAIGIGFAVPINMARAIMIQLVADGKMRYGALGMVTRSLAADMPEAKASGIFRGAIVESVLMGSPAMSAGVRIGDIITAIDDKPVYTSGDYISRVVVRPVGTKLPVEIFSQGALKRFALEVSDLVARPQPIAVAEKALGIGGALIVPILVGSKSFGIHRGVEITGSLQGSNAELLGLMKDDVITTIAGKRVTTPSEAIDVVALNADGFVFELVRDNIPIRIAVGTP